MCMISVKRERDEVADQISATLRKTNQSCPFISIIAVQRIGRALSKFNDEFDCHDCRPGAICDCPQTCFCITHTHCCTRCLNKQIACNCFRNSIICHKDTKEKNVRDERRETHARLPKHQCQQQQQTIKFSMQIKNVNANTSTCAVRQLPVYNLKEITQSNTE